MDRGKPFETGNLCRAGKTAVITGASRGIGAAAAVCFAEAGYLVVLNARDEDALQIQAKKIRENGGACEIFAGDIGEEETVNALFKRLPQLSKRYGSQRTLDVLVNNAGIAHIGLLQDMQLDQWNRLMRTNLTSAFLTCRAAIPFFLHEKAGHIINISSVWGVCGASCEAAYSASKGGENALTMALAKELAPSGIAVNAIACGAIDTKMNAQLDAEERMQLEAEIPAGRMGYPDEAAQLCLKLAQSSTYLTGQIIRLDGGWI